VISEKEVENMKCKKRTTLKYVSGSLSKDEAARSHVGCNKMGLKLAYHSYKEGTMGENQFLQLVAEAMWTKKHRCIHHLHKTGRLRYDKIKAVKVKVLRIRMASHKMARSTKGIFRILKKGVNIS
jgi:hypothetical protein